MNYNMEAQALQNETLSLAQSLNAQAKPRDKSDRPSVEIPVTSLVAFLKALKTKSQFDFDMLCSHTAVDWLGQNEFELIYQLYSIQHQHYLLVSTRVPRNNPVAPTISGLWAIAEWQEREVYDLFGVLYDGHPDLRRLFLEDDWKGFPLRKDYQDDFMLERPS